MSNDTGDSHNSPSRPRHIPGPYPFYPYGAIFEKRHELISRGHTPERDLDHVNQELVTLAAAHLAQAQHIMGNRNPHKLGHPQAVYPFNQDNDRNPHGNFSPPDSVEQNLIAAAAVIICELERMQQGKQSIGRE